MPSSLSKINVQRDISRLMNHISSAGLVDEWHGVHRGLVEELCGSKPVVDAGFPVRVLKALQGEFQGTVRQQLFGATQNG